MFPNAAHRHSWETFEAIFCIPFLVAIALEFLHGLSFPEGVRQVAVPVGAALIVAGLAVGVLARRELARRGQPTNPGLPTTGLVTTGVFRISRNPLYLGGAGIIGGIGLAFNLPWVLILLGPSIIAGHYVLIAPEERYLAGKFGEPYLRYAASVRRWIGRGRPSTPTDRDQQSPHSSIQG